LRYQSAHEHWVRYCATAGVDATLHQLRHTHATELANAGVSLATIRKRLGHRNLQTTLRYAEQSDAVADAELRAWRRRASQDVDVYLNPYPLFLRRLLLGPQPGGEQADGQEAADALDA
jgi:hypothetical protein